MAERRTVLITGSTSGLGLAAARRLAKAGHQVILHGRVEDRTRAIVERLQSELDVSFAYVIADLASLASVRAMAVEVVDRFDNLDVLINNAAISNWGRDRRETTVDGHERIFGTNYLSHYLLTRLLLPMLQDRPAARIINVGARQMKAAFDFDDLAMEHNYGPMRAVLQAKLGMFCLTRALSRRDRSHGVRVSCLDPGLVNTPYQSGASWIMRLVLRLLGRPPEEVARLYEWLAIDGEVAAEGRLYTAPGRSAPWRPYVADDGNVDRIWRESARLVGLP